MNKLLLSLALVSSISAHAADKKDLTSVTMKFKKTASTAAPLKPFNPRDRLVTFEDLNESAKRRADQIKMDKLKTNHELLGLRFSF